MAYSHIIPILSAGRLELLLVVVVALLQVVATDVVVPTTSPRLSSRLRHTKQTRLAEERCRDTRPFTTLVMAVAPDATIVANEGRRTPTTIIFPFYNTIFYTIFYTNLIILIHYYISILHYKPW
jgi:hypothetical protein